MGKYLDFNDRENWLEIRINDVKESYFIPDEINNDICVDVGGNVGPFSIVHNKDFKRIIAFEPGTYAYNKYENNISKFNLDNVELYKLAVHNVSDETLHLKKWLLGKINESGNASTIISNQWDETEFEEVLSISLEDIFKRFNLEKINFLKVDCEGGEYNFLMNKDLSKIDYISIEIHHQLKEKADELINYLHEHFIVLNSKKSGGQKHIIETLKNKLI